MPLYPQNPDKAQNILNGFIDPPQPAFHDTTNIIEKGDGGFPVGHVSTYSDGSQWKKRGPNQWDMVAAPGGGSASKKKRGRPRKNDPTDGDAGAAKDEKSQPQKQIFNPVRRKELADEVLSSGGEKKQIAGKLAYLGYTPKEIKAMTGYSVAYVYHGINNQIPVESNDGEGQNVKPESESESEPEQQSKKKRGRPKKEKPIEEQPKSDNQSDDESEPQDEQSSDADADESKLDDKKKTDDKPALVADNQDWDDDDDISNRPLSTNKDKKARDQEDSWLLGGDIDADTLSERQFERRRELIRKRASRLTPNMVFTGRDKINQIHIALLGFLGKKPDPNDPNAKLDFGKTSSNFILLNGSGGVGKTYNLEDIGFRQNYKMRPFDPSTMLPVGAGGVKASDSDDLDDDADDKKNLQVGEYEYVKLGDLSAPILYKNLYQHNGKVILIDDADAVLDDPVMVNLLKNATQTSGKRIVAREKGNQKEVPSSFEFTGKIVIVTNKRTDALQKNGDLNALYTRADALTISMKTDEALDYMEKEVLPNMKFLNNDGSPVPGITQEGKDFVFGLVKEYAAMGSLPDSLMNSRILGKWIQKYNLVMDQLGPTMGEDKARDYFVAEMVEKIKSASKV